MAACKEGLSWYCAAAPGCAVLLIRMSVSVNFSQLIPWAAEKNDASLLVKTKLLKEFSGFFSCSLYRSLMSSPFMI